MIPKSVALRIMEKTNGDGKRIPFHIVFLTAKREQWRAKLIAQKELATLPADSPEYKIIKAKIDAMDVGGHYIEHHKCLLSGPRGMHAKKQKIESENPLKNPKNTANRTRNIVFMPSNQIRKIHNSSVFEINREEVIY